MVKADDTALKNALEAANTTQVTIDATAGSSSAVKRIEFGAGILKLAAEKNKPVIIETGRHVFELPPGAVPVNDSNATAILTVTPSADETALSKKPAQAKEISRAYDFSLSLGGESITRFAVPLPIRWKLGTRQAQPEKLGVYHYNEAAQSWDYIGGKASSDGTVSFTTDHFSRFAVMEYNKTFDDMAQHWAKKEVELLAAKHIVTGLTDTSFVPEQPLTRAEFAALLVRTLGVKTGSGTGSFQDVNRSDWFYDTVYKAYGAGLIEGLDAATFAPGQPITREQMAVMIMRAYTAATGQQPGGIVITQEVKFTDEGATGSWARSSIRLSNGLGLMGGFPDGSFKPSDTATRAQAAVVIKRLLDLTQK